MCVNIYNKYLHNYAECAIIEQTAEYQKRKLSGGGNVAVSEVSGKIPGFDLTDAELAAKIEAYKQGVEDGSIPFPFWTDFRESLGVKQEALDEVMQRGYFGKNAANSAYYNRAHMLKKMGETCENWLITHPNWQGRNATKSTKLLAQGLGWTRKYVEDKSKGQDEQKQNVVIFGGGDSRWKDAGK